MTSGEILDSAAALAEAVLAPRANETDQADRVPEDLMARMASLGFAGITIPTAFGGCALNKDEQRAYQEEIAAACGVTAFVWNQHHSASGRIAGGANEALKAALLPSYATGARLTGIAFSHVRRAGPPMLVATETAAGWLLDGDAPWATGWGIFQDLLVAAEAPGGRILWCVVPFAAAGSSTASSAMQLAVMNASRTVTMTYRALHVPRGMVALDETRDAFDARERANLLNHATLAFATSGAAIRLLRPRAGQALVQALETELAAVRARVERWRGREGDPRFAAAATTARAAAIDMAQRAAMAAVAAFGGASNERSHTAQRLYREALFAAVSGQSLPIRAGTLDHLAALAHAAAERSAAAE